MKRSCVIILLFLISFAYGYGQKIAYFGKISDKESSGNLSGVTVSAISDGETVTSVTTSTDGEYSLELEPKRNYTIKYEKAGYVSKIISIETEKVNPEDMPPGGRIFPPIDLKLFKDIEGADFSFLETEPVVTWYFDRAGMNWDKRQANRMKKKIEKAIETAEENAEAQEEKYTSLINEADGLFKAEKYEEALNKYGEALKIPGKATEEYPSTQIIKIEDILQEKDEQELAAKQDNEEYANFINAADNLVEEEKYDKAIENYNKALDLKPEEQYPKDKIAEVQGLQEKADKQDQFDELVESADAFFDQNSLKAARDKYQKALKILPDEDYPQQQLDEIENQLEAKSEELEKQKKYNDAIEAADNFFDKEEYEEAIDKYKEAISYESASTYPQQRIELAEEKLAEQKAQKEKEEQFQQLVKEGDEQLALKKYQAAIDLYNQALEIIEDEAITKKRDDTQELLDELTESEEKENQIASLLESGQEKLDNADYQGAIDDFTGVLELDDQNADAIEGKKNAERLLTNKQEEEAEEEEFNDLVAAADEAYDAEEWEDAKSKYIAAKGIFDDRDHVNNRIDEIRKILQKEKAAEDIAEEIQILLDQAEQLKSDNNWDKVIQKYEEALQLNEQRDDVATLLEEAKNSKEEWQSQQQEEELFTQLKEDGQLLMNNKEWEEAISKFEEALVIKDDEEIEKNIEIIEDKIAAAEQSEEQEQAYSDKMDKAEDYATDKEYEDAIATFKEALEIKEDDPLAKSRIKDIQQKIDQKEELEEKEERYETAMQEAQKALDDEDYSAAIKFYDDALIEKPLDEEATRLKKEAKIKISNLQSEEEIYQELLSTAQKKYDEGLSKNNDIPILKVAKEKYEEAQEMRPKASLPQNRIVEIDQLIRTIEEERNKEENREDEYQDLLDLASVSAQNNKFQNAIDHLKEASEIKPDEEFPKQKIKEYQDLLDQRAEQEELNQQYADKVSEADLAFDNKDYDESIDLYNEALSIKEDESYPKSQIRKAKKAKKNKTESAINQAYNNHIKEADKHFSDEDYEAAIDAYNEALEVKEDDEYAKERVQKAKEEIKRLNKKAAEESAELKAFNKHIQAADSLFENEKYIDAKEEYEEGLKIKPNDVYANEQVHLCVEKSKEKTRQGDEKRYQKILTVADKYFDEENYDKATNLYKRAIKFRSTDQYPKDKLAEIKAIKSGDAKRQSNIEDLGEQSDISLIEGAALLEQGAKQREQLKLESIQNEITKHEGNAKDRSDKDYQERVEYRDEVVAIQDLRDANHVDEKEQHRVFIDQVDDIEYNWEKQITERKKYEQGDADRTYRNVVYINDEMDNVKREKKDDNDEIVEKIKILEKDRDRQTNAEAAKNRANIEATGDELLKVEKQNEQMVAENKEKQEDLQVQVDDIIKGRELQTHEEKNDNYDKVMQLQNDAKLAEIKDAESKEDKIAIHEQLQDDMKVLAAELQRKEEQQSDEVYQAQLEVDQQLARAKDNYEETKTKKDEERQQIVENVKDLELNQIKQADLRSKEQYQKTQDNLEEVIKVKDMRSEQAQKNKKDLESIDRGVKAQEEEMDRANEVRRQKEESEHQNTVSRLERIEKEYEITTKGKDDKTKQNYEDVKGLEASINSNEQARQKRSKNEKIETQKLVNQLENNSIAFSEKVANTIGDEYPEGVSQENYIRKDKDGIPVRIVTRRFVVNDGHGDIYIRIQSRNGLTYSKNGSPITEQSWINGTEDAGLEKHY